MSEDEGLLPVVAVRQFFFCRQIPYLNLVLHVVEPETDSMVYSKERHELFRAQYLPRSIRPKKVYTGVDLRSERLGLVGKLDALVETYFGELIPCELKHSALRRGRPLLKDVVQLTAYAMLVEDVYGCVVKRGVLYYAEDGEKPEIRILQSHRYMVKMAVKHIREMMASEEAPEEKNLKECPSCWYRRICYT